MPVAPPSPPFLGPARWYRKGGNRPIRRVVVHCTAGAEPGTTGAARGTAAFTKSTSRPSSWHYCADAELSVQLVWDSDTAYHDGSNVHSIGYEICCSLADEGRGHWDGPEHKKALKIAAADIARLCLANSIPIRHLSVAEIRADAKGLCGHVDMRDAFPGRTVHWDPGPVFPWAAFLKMVRAEARALTAPEPEPEPDPVPEPVPTVPGSSLHLMHASMEYTDSYAQALEDFAAAFAAKPDAVTFTEANRKATERALLDAAAAAGYEVVTDLPGGERIAVAGRHDVAAYGFEVAIPALRMPMAKGGHGQRGVSWATFQTDAGETATVHVAHWLTGDRDDTGQNVRLTRAMIAAVEEHAPGAALSFFAGDTNVDEQTDRGQSKLKPHALFGSSGLLTVYDELRLYPDTHGKRTIDVIGSFQADRRVSAREVKVWPTGNSDHRRVSAWYDVAAKPAPVAKKKAKR